MRSGCRSYLAVRGGFDVTPVLGSRSTDVNAQLGPLAGRPLRAGDAVEMGPSSFFSGNSSTRNSEKKIEPDPISHWQLDSRPWFPEEAPATLRLLPGSHFDKLTEISCKLLFSETFAVQADSNRVGLR